MRKYALLPALAFAALIAIHPVSAQAQQMTPQKFDQYPSFVELTASTQDGTQTILRCGYTVNGTPALDPDFQEVTVVNQGKNTYARFQHIDTSIIATSMAPADEQGLLLELVRPDGSATAKHCQSNTENDTISNCQTVQTFAPGDQIKAAAQQMYTQCASVIQQGTNQINPGTADSAKTAVFKDGLREKVQLLQMP